MDKGSKRYIPVFEGLLTHDHIDKMGFSVFLFMELLRRSKGTPRVEVTYRDLQEKLGKPIRTLENWMKNLRDENYITVEGKNPMIVTIKKYRSIKSGEIQPLQDPESKGTNPPEMVGHNPPNMVGPEKPNPPGMVETSPNMVGPNAITPVKTDISEPPLKYKNKRESLSLKKSSNSKPKNGKKTNPEVTIIRCHFYKEFEKTHGYEPYMDGKHSAIFKRLLEGDKENGNPPIRIEELKELITKFFVLRDGNIFEKRHPVEWLPGQINALRGKKKQSEELEVAL